MQSQKLQNAQKLDHRALSTTTVSVYCSLSKCAKMDMHSVTALARCHTLAHLHLCGLKHLPNFFPCIHLGITKEH